MHENVSRSLSLIILAVVTGAIAGITNAAVMDFDGLPFDSTQQTSDQGLTVSEDGFTVESLGQLDLSTGSINTSINLGLESVNPLSSACTGSTSIVIDTVRGMVELTADGGTPFALSSIDLAEFSSNNDSRISPDAGAADGVYVEFTGFLAGGARSPGLLSSTACSASRRSTSMRAFQT